MADNIEDAYREAYEKLFKHHNDLRSAMRRAAHMLEYYRDVRDPEAVVDAYAILKKGLSPNG